MKEWRIRKSASGYYAEHGAKHNGGALGPSGIGYTMESFIVYVSARFDTEKEAERYIREEVAKEN